MPMASVSYSSTKTTNFSCGTDVAATAAAVDLELLGTAANVQNVAATKMTAAVDTFAAWVANLPASIQVVVPVSEVNA